MATVEANKLSKQELAELACSYASLILYDDGQDITHEKINKLISSAGVQVESYWAKIFAKAVSGQDIGGMFNFGGGNAPAAQTTAVSEPKKEEKKEPKKEEKPVVKEEPEEDDVGMGGLFD